MKMKALKKLAVGSLFVSCAVVSATALAVDKEASFSPAQVEKIEKVVHDYLVRDPQVLIEASRALQKQAVADEQKQIEVTRELANKNSQKLFDRKDQMVLGSTNPKIIVAEFFTYQCPNCRLTSPAVDKLLQSNKDVQLVLINWPFQGESDVYAAQVALASHKQGKFNEIHHAFMNASGALTKEKVDQIVKEQGLDMAKLQQDLKDTSIEKALKANFKLAETLKLLGAPTIFVTNDKLSKVTMIPGRANEASFQKAIDEVR